MSSSVYSDVATQVTGYSRFREDLVITRADEGNSTSRYCVHDPVSDISFELGKAEYRLAMLFDGKRSLHEVASTALDQLRMKVSEDKLAQFERRLLHLKLLSQGDGTHKKDLQDPATGITYGPLKTYLLVNLIKMNPQPLLDSLYRLAPWCCSRGFVAPLLLLALCSFGYLGMHMDAFIDDAVVVYAQSYRWLLWHFPVILTSIALHELGHAMACRHYRVNVTDFGIGIYLLLATGWVRPEQRTWTKLPLGQRVTTILAGPFVSLLYAGVGIALWAAWGGSGPFGALFVVMIVASFISLVPTLLPIFNGDTYLAITEWLGQPRLRQRAFNYVKGRHRATAQPVSPAMHRLYWGTVLLTGLGWIAAWGFTANTLIHLFNHP
ncbi:M50 family metallopeptidase [Pseudomonas sp. MWU13-3659]|uniref:M50 family metallopeptidase n=1 Tax=Pseudomonas sp. MWU13-3659 TaxID=2986964 RepID=UPI0020755836|nr:M50 family metallopeptidase [Pseudomonas sp. MWU13-3659]